jgi:hypothetical protein
MQALLAPAEEVTTPFAFAVHGPDRGEAETDRRIYTTLDAQIRDGLLEEIAQLDRRYRLVEHGERTSLPISGLGW